MSDNPLAELFAAMAKAFPAIEGASKDAENEAFKRGGKATKYADLSSVVEAIKPALVANKLFFMQLTHEQVGGVCIETVVCHEKGGQLSFGKLFVPASKNDAHGYGSALTYARRYSLMAAFGVCPEDDDGNAATASAPPQQNAVGINKDQLAKIQAEIDRTGTDIQAMCAHYKVDALTHLPAAKFDAAMKALGKKETTNGAAK